ncbi:MAG: cyclic nucleotide-binding domain-containing protein [Anaerolineae bacterium]|nr:cyclic nucleotide-binding domain-containing protein [Anaerolineae bacterium]
MADITPAHLELIAAICEEATYQMNALVFAERTVGEHLYIIADGAVDIELDPSLIGASAGTESLTVATLRRGQSFGEVALVDEGVRSAAARAAQHNTHLILIPRDELMQLCDAHPQLGYRLMRNLAADLAMKIRNTDLAVRERILWARDAE